jgi:hypothetical protein
MPKQRPTVQVVRPRKRKGFVDHTVKTSVSVHPNPNAETPSAHVPHEYLRSKHYLNLMAAGAGPETEAFFAGLPLEIANTPDPEVFVDFVVGRQIEERAQIVRAEGRIKR